MLTIDTAGPKGFQTTEHQSEEGFSAMDWMEKGESAFSGGNLREAQRCFEKALAWSPFDPKLHNNLSVVHWQQGQTEEALHCLTRALELDPNDQDVILNCSHIFQAVGKEQDARDILEAYLLRRPWDPEVRIELEKIGKPPEPKTVEQKTDSRDPAVFLNEQGEQQFERGRLDHARVCFELAMEHNPNYARALSNLGVVVWRQGDLKNALELLYRALDIDCVDADILYNCSKALEAAGETETAADLLQMYLRQNPQDETVWQEYDSLLRRMGNSVWKAKGLSPEVGDLYTQMGEKLARLEDYPGATDAFQRALSIDPGRSEVFYLLGRLHLELGQETQALEILREGLKSGEFYKKIALLMGEILVSLGRREEARAIYRDYLAGAVDDDMKKALDALSM